jgi:CRISPR type IV-associated protein Csf3
MRKTNIAFNRPPRAAFEPLKITALLQTPVISDEYLPLDAVLYYQAMREKYGSQDATFSGQDHPRAVAGITLPIARCNEQNPLWYYAASFAQWPNSVTQGMDHWNRRLDLSLVDLIDWQGKKARIDVSAGRYKSYHMPVYYRHAIEAHWFVLGQRSEIEKLLAHTTNLGKKTAQGWGAVGEWRVDSTPADYSVRGPNGELMRAVPASGGILTGIRPSYWLPKNQAPCAMPARATPGA